MIPVFRRGACLAVGVFLLWAATVSAVTVTYSHDADGRLTQADFGDFVINYTYDDNGSLLQRNIVDNRVKTLATLTTAEATLVAATSADSGGTITSDGNAEVTARGVCWSTAQNPTTSDGRTQDGTGTGTFASSLTGLFPETLYYARAYATNSQGTAYGNQITFTTLDLPVISGTVTDGSAPVAGVLITFSHDGSTTTTAGDGTYAHPVPMNSNTTVSPSLGAFTFTPTSRSFTLVTSDQPNADFLLDDDGDGTPATEEFGPDGDDPSYDGNGDGQPDAGQPHVTSMHTNDGTGYVTLSTSTGATSLSASASGSPSAGDSPGGMAFVHEFFDITMTDSGPGFSDTLTLILPAGQTLTDFWNYGPTPDNPSPHWYLFAYDGATGAVINGNIITLYFTDGMLGDGDLTANGSISATGGPAVSGTIPTLTQWGFIILLLMLAGLSWNRLSRRQETMRG